MYGKNRSFLRFLNDQIKGYQQLFEPVVFYLEKVHGLSKIYIYKYRNAPDFLGFVNYRGQVNKYEKVLYSADINYTKIYDNLLSLDNIYALLLRDPEDLINYVLIIEANESQINDISKQYWEEIDILYKLAKANEKLSQEVIQDKSTQIVSRIAHDINSLISLIPENNNDNLNVRIIYSKQLSEDIIVYLRDYSLRTIWYSCEELFEGVIAEIKKIDGINYHTKTEENLGYIHVDIELIEQALSFVLENAAIACQIEGNEIDIVFERKNNRSIFADHDWLTVSVKDNGPGIPAEYITEVTKPLFTTWKDQGHIGLGLSMTEKIIQAHGGSLAISSEAGRGTIISFYLPMYNGKIQA